MTESPAFAKQSDTVASAETLRKMVRTMRSGQEAMIAARETYLPRFEIENDRRYNSRLGRTVFTSFIGEAVGFGVGQVFSREIKWGDDVPKDILGWLENVDLRGNSAHLFLMEIFRDYWWEGCGLFLVDMPPLALPEGRSRLTLADEQTQGRRPYWTRYPIEDVLGWREKTIGGNRVYTQLRLAESVQVEDGAYGEKKEKRVRVYWGPDESLSVASYAAWRFDPAAQAADQWVPIQDRTPLTIDEIPLVHLGELSGAPPLLELGHMNLADYQVWSDYRNIMYIVSVPIPVAKGIAPEKLGESVKLWAADGIVATSNADADFGYWQYTGANIEELKMLISDNRIEMGRRAMRTLLEQRPGTVTATSDAITAGRSYSNLQASAIRLQDSAENGQRLMAKWVGKGEDAGGSAEVNRQFFSLPMKDQAKAWIEWGLAQGLLSKEGAFDEAKRYEAFSDGLDFETEQERIAQQGQQLGTIGSERQVAKRAMEMVREGVPEDEAMERAMAEMEGLDRAVEAAA